MCRWVGEAGGGIGNVPPGFMESAMGNPEQEELWAEKEEEDRSGIRGRKVLVDQNLGIAVTTQTYLKG